MGRINYDEVDKYGNNDMDYILSQAISQAEDGAEILDINVGHPEIDEKEMMVKVVKAVHFVKLGRNHSLVGGIVYHPELMTESVDGRNEIVHGGHGRILLAQGLQHGARLEG